METKRCPKCGKQILEVTEELKRLQGIQQGIEWIKYDRNSSSIESHVNHLVTDGQSVRVAQHAKNLKSQGYGWHEGRKPLKYSVTYWAKINFPL
ncbi:hypothetical protein [Paenibacillus mesotrionivorans]|uniref:Uncharacterized protein n=1 Tax=Paenibacillus mesotrionivorans TaxID=3160968 RepID=A0ACC7NXA1_9BACL